MARLSFPLLTDRLTLRPFTDGHLDVLHDMQSREEVTRHLYWGRLLSGEPDRQAGLRQTGDRWDDEDGLELVFELEV